MKRGRFVTFEGGEGAGKSTQVARLLERLREHGLGAIATREPGGSDFGEQVRRFILDPDTAPHPALAEALLFSAARVDHIEKVIAPALANGEWVICDRFADSTRAYQGAAGGVSDAAMDTLEALVLKDCRPALTIILDLPAKQGLVRVGLRAGRDVGSDHGDPYEARALDFHEALRTGFLTIAKGQPERCVLIDGTQDEDTVAGLIWQAVEARLLPGAG